MSLANGFFQGFGAVNNYYDRQDSKDFRNQAYDDQQKQQERQNKRQDNQDAMDKSNHAVTMANKGLELSLNGKKVQNYDEDRELNVKSKNASINASNASINASNTRNNLTQKQVNAVTRQEQAEKFNFYMASENPFEAFSDPALKNTNFALLDSPKVRQAAMGLSKKLNNPDFIQDASIITDANTVFKRQLNKNVGTMEGRNGSQIVDIEIIGLEQTDDEMVKLPIMVTTKDGSYQSYVSELRGIDANDPDKVFDFQTLFGTASALGDASMMLEQSGYNQGLQDRFSQTSSFGQDRLKPTAAMQNDMYYSQKYGTDRAEQKTFGSRDPNAITINMEAVKVGRKAAEDLARSTFGRATEAELEQAYQSAYNQILQAGSTQPVQATNPANPAPQPSTNMTPEQKLALDAVMNMYKSEEAQ